tara:strand:+ start:5057 stop:5158 length:102 start_codon:yes stop_codon:yes gene_type:complete
MLISPKYQSFAFVSSTLTDLPDIHILAFKKTSK